VVWYCRPNSRQTSAFCTAALDCRARRLWQSALFSPWTARYAMRDAGLAGGSAIKFAHKWYAIGYSLLKPLDAQFRRSHSLFQAVKKCGLRLQRKRGACSQGGLDVSCTSCRSSCARKAVSALHAAPGFSLAPASQISKSKRGERNENKRCEYSGAWHDRWSAGRLRRRDFQRYAQQHAKTVDAQRQGGGNLLCGVEFHDRLYAGTDGQLQRRQLHGKLVDPGQ